MASIFLILLADVFLLPAGQVRSATGKEFQTTVWITNLAPRPTYVHATFLERHPLKAPPASVTMHLGPHETAEKSDLPLQLHRPGIVGAIRFQSAEPIVVSARIFSGQATGAGRHAVPPDAGLAKGDEGMIPGVAFGGDFRQTTYFVETTGRPVGILIRLRDAAGRELAHNSFLLEAYEQRAMPIAELAGGAFVHQGSISIRVTGGSGRVYATGLEILKPTGDGYFVEMTALRAQRAFGLSAAEIVLYLLTALAVFAAIATRRAGGAGSGPPHNA